MRKFARGFLIRGAVATGLAVAVGLGLFAPLPRWSWPVVLLLHRPIMLAWSILVPSSDSYPPFTPSALFPGFLLYLAVAVSVYIALTYAPKVGSVSMRTLWRATFQAARTPVPFIVYGLMGGLVGGLAGFGVWAAFTGTASTVALITCIMAGSIVLAWVAGVMRCAVERQQSTRGT